MVYLLIPETRREIEIPISRRRYPYGKNIRAKFVGRAIYRWGGENLLNDPRFWYSPHTIMSDLHAHDQDIIFQGCLFEIITEEVEKVNVPEWVFHAYGLPVESRNFSYKAMLNQQGKFVDHWRKGSSAPDISERETQLWFYFLACSYINVGCEAFHLGQVELIGMNDPKEMHGRTFIRFACMPKNMRAGHWVLLDAHVPYGGMLKGDQSLLILTHSH